MTTRTVRVIPCRNCGQRTLVGLDQDCAALTVALDPDPVDEVGEALAVLSGRTTYDLRPVGGRAHGRAMTERTAARLRDTPAVLPVHAAHRCGQPLPVKSTPAAAWDEGDF